MDENDLQIIHELMKKAAINQNYGIAISLKHARNELRKQINDKWTNDIIEKFTPKI